MNFLEEMEAGRQNAEQVAKFRGKMTWEARQFIKSQYESGKTNFYEVFDFYSTFTPIEFAIWQDICAFDLPFLPEYPVGKYFADFACPKKHIAIECDGKHHDKARDKERDKYFQSEGWTVYRIPGKDCFGETGTAIIREIAGRLNNMGVEAVAA